MAFVVSAGNLTSVHRTTSPVPFGLRLADDYTADYAEIWRTQPAVRTVVSFLARNIASLGLHAYRRVSDTDRERLSDHPLTDLLGRPSPMMTKYRLVNALVQDLGIYDRALWVKVAAGDSRGVIRVPPKQFTTLGESWIGPEGFEIRGNKGRKQLTNDQAVYFHGYRPEDDKEGCSPIESLRRVLAEEFEAGRYREQTFRNGARMSGYIERPADAPKWDPKDKIRFREQWRAQYAGNGPSAGGTPILEDGMKFVAHSQTAEQLQYIESRKLTREEVAAAYFIPPPMVGILDDATYSNIEQQHRMLYQDTLGPWLVQIQEEIDLQLVPDIPGTDRVYVEFNIAEKLKGSFEQQASALQTMVGAPVMTRNEGRARLNLPSIDGGDELITPLNVLEGGQASPTDSAPKTQLLPAKAFPAVGDLELAQTLEAFFRRQERAVKSRLGANPNVLFGPDVWDSQRWDTELAKDLQAAGLTDAPGAARRINEGTAALLKAALVSDDPKTAVTRMFDLAADARSVQIAAELAPHAA